MAMKMRGCAIIITSITELRPASAPTVDEHLDCSHRAGPRRPAARSAAACTAITSGAGWFSIAL